MTVTYFLLLCIEHEMILMFPVVLRLLSFPHSIMQSLELKMLLFVLSVSFYILCAILSELLSVSSRSFNKGFLKLFF